MTHQQITDAVKVLRENLMSRGEPTPEGIDTIVGLVENVFHNLQTISDSMRVIASPGAVRDAVRAAAVKVVASSHELQDGRHDTPDGMVLVDKDAIIELAATLA